MKLRAGGRAAIGIALIAASCWWPCVGGGVLFAESATAKPSDGSSSHASAPSAASPSASAPGTQVVASNVLARGVLVHPDDGPTRLLESQDRAFAALVLRDPGSDRLAIVHQGDLSDTARADTSEGSWNPRRRFWHEPSWGSDVNALVWGLDGRGLFVSTGGRGSGAVYRLDLRSRTARCVWPDSLTSTPEQGKGRSCEILRVDVPRKLLHVRYQAATQRAPVSVDVRLE